jgi:signal transduction histidine kinase
MVRSAMLWGLGVMAVFGIGGGYWVSRKLLARIDALSDTTRTIMEGDLTGRLAVNGSGDELDRLSESLNLMLARIEQLMAGLREVSDNIAHDLKTPLNRLRNRVEAALREPYGEPVYREALERTIEEADGLIKTFNALLSIARIEAGAGGDNRETLDVSALLRDVAELYEPVAEERGLVLKAEAAAPIFIRADRQLLGQAIANLVDNAIKYGTTGVALGGPGAKPEIEVSAKIKGPIAEIMVTDRGPGVPVPDRERVLDRFVRLEASRSEPGSGLGLSLVAAVARLHGGSLRLEDNAPGLRVILALPLEGEALVNGAPHQAPAGAEIRPA